MATAGIWPVCCHPFFAGFRRVCRPVPCQTTVAAWWFSNKPRAISAWKAAEESGHKKRGAAAPLHEGGTAHHILLYPARDAG